MPGSSEAMRITQVTIYKDLEDSWKMLRKWRVGSFRPICIERCGQAGLWTPSVGRTKVGGVVLLVLIGTTTAASAPLPCGSRAPEAVLPGIWFLFVNQHHSSRLPEAAQKDPSCSFFFSFCSQKKKTKVFLVKCRPVLPRALDTRRVL